MTASQINIGLAIYKNKLTGIEAAKQAAGARGRLAKQADVYRAWLCIKIYVNKNKPVAKVFLEKTLLKSIFPLISNRQQSTEVLCIYLLVMFANFNLLTSFD